MERDLRQKELDEVDRPRCGGQDERSVSAIRFGLQARAFFDQQVDDVFVAAIRGPHQRSEAFGTLLLTVEFGVDIGAGGQEELELLLTAGANVNAKLDGQQEGAEGFTALMWAAYGGHKDIVDLLIKKGAGLEAKSDRGYTPLILAATAGSVDLIELFLSQVSLHP